MGWRSTILMSTSAPHVAPAKRKDDIAALGEAGIGAQVERMSGPQSAWRRPETRLRGWGVLLRFFL
jgi:hypothetical protein